MSTNIDLLGDRHFRTDPQGVLRPKRDGRCGRVLLTVAPFLADTPAGQHLAWMLTNQLARQFGVVTKITLHIPEAALIENTAAFGAKTSLRDTLAECVRLVAREHVEVQTGLGSADHFEVHIAVGAARNLVSAERAWCLYADGWRWYVGNGTHIPTNRPTSNLSFGPYMAASFAAGEAFKHLRGMLPNKGVFITECLGSAWTMSLGTTWNDLMDGPGNEALPALPHFYFAGAGAVAQAAALTLGSSRLRGSATVIDHDTLDLTNGNRYVLSPMDDDQSPKANIVSAYLTKQGLLGRPAPVKWSTYVGAQGGMTGSESIRRLEQRYRFPTVLSCVDKNGPRHEIQSLLPEIIIGGSTDGLVARVSTFYMAHDAACLKCFNPIEDRNAIIEKKLRLLVTMTADEREAWVVEHSLPVADIARLLAPSVCGQLSESDLQRFAEGPPEMSVGFVSVTAGVLLSAQLVRLVQRGVDDATQNGHTVITTFAQASMRHLRSGPDAQCNCAPELRSRWHRLWGAPEPSAGY
ncbi:MAG TPA: hypothetical protein VMV40_04995 [Acidiferrobacter sp.]|nr:hypothetical protein [Acidiferrobacter sp.]